MSNHHYQWVFFWPTLIRFRKYDSLFLSSHRITAKRMLFKILNYRHPWPRMFFRLYLSCDKVGNNVACTCWSNLGALHQLPITAAWNTKSARHFFAWPALGIEPKTFWLWVKYHIYLAMWPYLYSYLSVLMKLHISSAMQQWAGSKLRAGSSNSSLIVRKPRNTSSISATSWGSSQRLLCKITSYSSLQNVFAMVFYQ